MSSRISTATFRVSVPNSTPAITPVSVTLDLMSSVLQRISIFASGAVDFSKCGFRIRNNATLLIPDGGSQEAGITFLQGEQNWAGLVNSPIELPFGGRDLYGPPYGLTVDFYNTTGAAISVAGFVATSMPEYTVHDLVIELQKARLAALPIQGFREVAQDKQSIQPVAPVMKQGK